MRVVCVYFYVLFASQEIITFWLRKGVDGFRVDAIPHLFETNYTSDEPESNIKGVTKDDYNYLIHTLTKDQPQTYDLVQNWRKIMDDYASYNNIDEKVHLLSTSHTSIRIFSLLISKYYFQKIRVNFISHYFSIYFSICSKYTHLSSYFFTYR